SMDILTSRTLPIYSDWSEWSSDILLTPLRNWYEIAGEGFFGKITLVVVGILTFPFSASGALLSCYSSTREIQAIGPDDLHSALFYLNQAIKQGKGPIAADALHKGIEKFCSRQFAEEISRNDLLLCEIDLFSYTPEQWLSRLACAPIGTLERKNELLKAGLRKILLSEVVLVSTQDPDSSSPVRYAIPQNPKSPIYMISENPESPVLCIRSGDYGVKRYEKHALKCLFRDLCRKNSSRRDRSTGLGIFYSRFSPDPIYVEGGLSMPCRIFLTEVRYMCYTEEELQARIALSREIGGYIIPAFFEKNRDLSPTFENISLHLFKEPTAKEYIHVFLSAVMQAEDQVEGANAPFTRKEHYDFIRTYGGKFVQKARASIRNAQKMARILFTKRDYMIRQCKRIASRALKRPASIPSSIVIPNFASISIIRFQLMYSKTSILTNIVQELCLVEYYVRELERNFNKAKEQRNGLSSEHPYFPFETVLKACFKECLPKELKEKDLEVCQEFLGFIVEGCWNIPISAEERNCYTRSD
ncbi:MAG: hypothetical protein AAGF04_05495, partial [Chlamydiota bacterium]